jgi:hypothetical protein
MLILWGQGFLYLLLRHILSRRQSMIHQIRTRVLRRLSNQISAWKFMHAFHQNSLKVNLRIILSMQASQRVFYQRLVEPWTSHHWYCCSCIKLFTQYNLNYSTSWNTSISKLKCLVSNICHIALWKFVLLSLSH